MKVIYPGSFDPITNGHIDIIKKIMNIYPSGTTISVLVMNNDDKSHMFTHDERTKKVVDSLWTLMPQVMAADMVESFSGNINDYIAQQDRRIVIVRGLRNNTDFAYEMTFEAFTRRCGAQTTYITPNPENLFVSSSLVRNLINTNADYKDLVPW